VMSNECFSLCLYPCFILLQLQTILLVINGSTISQHLHIPWHGFEGATWPRTNTACAVYPIVEKEMFDAWTFDGGFL